MDQQMKDELLRRWRQRMPVHMDTDGLSINTTIAKWIIDIVADARELELSIEVDQPVYDPKDVEVTIGDGVGLDPYEPGMWLIWCGDEGWKPREVVEHENRLCISHGGQDASEVFEVASNYKWNGRARLDRGAREKAWREG